MKDKEDLNKMCPSHGHPKFYGSASIGERGQIVVPADLREAFGINPGDKFVFFSMGKAISLIKADDAQEMIENMSRMISFKEEIENAIKN